MAIHAAIQALGSDIARNDLAPALVHESTESGPQLVGTAPGASDEVPS